MFNNHTNFIVKSWLRFQTANYKFHLVFAFLLRIIFVLYGIYHDGKSVVQYTDVDYKVFTDASRHILNGQSPYDRHTYRYTPLVAVLLTPNILMHHACGKILFCFIDVIIGLLIRTIVINTFNDFNSFKGKAVLELKGSSEVSASSTDDNQGLQDKKWDTRHKVRLHKKSKFIELRHNSVNDSDVVANNSLLFWLYNPMSIAISTRGNCDSIAGFLVLATLYFLQCKRASFVAGLIHGFSIHIRLYPIAYSLALFMYLSQYSYFSLDKKTKNNSNRKAIRNANESDNRTTQNIISKKENLQRKTIFDKKYLLYLIPNLEQLKLIFGCIVTLISTTAFFYYLYGYKFLHETYIYHLVRKDSRHNFSLYFYLQYLTAGVKNIGLWQKVLTILPQIVLLIVLSVRYGLNKFSLNFSILTQTIVMVTFNSVLTSQYFIWIMAVLPLCLWQIEMSATTAILWMITWLMAQGAWLLPAYFLEFQGQNTFLLIWIQGVAFFCANIAILGRLIMNFMPRRKYKMA